MDYKVGDWIKFTFNNKTIIGKISLAHLVEPVAIKVDTYTLTGYTDGTYEINDVLCIAKKMHPKFDFGVTAYKKGTHTAITVKKIFYENKTSKFYYELKNEPFMMPMTEDFLEFSYGARLDMILDCLND